MPIPTLPDLDEFESHPSPKPASDTETDRVEPIVISQSEDIMYLHGPHIPQQQQFLAAEIDERPLLRMDPRERYAEIVVDTTHINYSLSANAIRRIHATAEPYFEEAQSTPSDVEFSFRPIKSSPIAGGTPRGKVTIDGLEIDAAKDLLGDLAETVGEYTDFVHLTKDEFDSPFGPSRHLPREGAPSVHQPDGVEDPFQIAPVENKAITAEQIEDHYSKSTLREANKLISSRGHKKQRYWAGAGHGEMANKGVSGFCKRYITPPEPGCQVHISGGEIVEETCSSDDHNAPCKHTAAALLLAPSVSDHYL